MKTSLKGKYIVSLTALVFAFSCKGQKSTDKQVYVRDTVYLTDTLYVPEQNDTLYTNLFALEARLGLIQDSLRIYKEDLFVAQYKLERIREYNRIAGQGSNLKFLRGWINRVLKD